MHMPNITSFDPTTMSLATNLHYNYASISPLKEDTSNPGHESPCRYADLESIDERLQGKSTRQRQRCKRILGTSLFAACLTYIAVWALKGSLVKFGQFGCNGGHALPTSYTLPSGDNIPSVALGTSWYGVLSDGALMCLALYCRCLASRERQSGRSGQGTVACLFK